MLLVMYNDDDDYNIYDANYNDTVDDANADEDDTETDVYDDLSKNDAGGLLVLYHSTSRKMRLINAQLFNTTHSLG